MVGELIAMMMVMVLAFAMDIIVMMTVVASFLNWSPSLASSL